MTHEHEPSIEERHHTDDQAVQRLLHSAGPRESLPEEDFRVAKAAARLAWEGTTRRDRDAPRHRLLVPAAASALLVLSIATVVWWRGSEAPKTREQVATVELLRGSVWLEEPPDVDTGDESSLTIGGALTAGVELVTGMSEQRSVDALAIRLAAGQSLRLDGNSRIRLISAGRIQLLEGAVYIDSGPSPESDPVEVLTAFGSVVDIGTQFEVRLDAEDRLQVRVRTGAVSLHRQGHSHTAGVGEELRLQADGSVLRARWESEGADLDWILSAAPPLDIEGVRLGAFLDWVCSETGWNVEYDADVLPDAVEDIELHGTIEGLRPDESVAVVLPGSGLAHRVEEGTLFIGRLTPGDSGI